MLRRNDIGFNEQARRQEARRQEARRQEARRQEARRQEARRQEARRQEQDLAAVRARVKAEAARFKEQIEQVAPGAANQPLVSAALDICAAQPDANSALHFAFDKLESQQRGPDAEPRILHTLRVTGIVAAQFQVIERRTVLTALLHDVLEDSPTRPAEIEELFGPTIAESVKMLTKPAECPKPERQRIHRQTLASAPEPVVLVKLADYHDNLQCRRGTGRVVKTFESAKAFVELLGQRVPLQPQTRHAMRLLRKVLRDVSREDPALLVQPSA